MKYQAYPAYKDSGVEWLGDVPEHWQRLKFKFFAKQSKVFASGPFGSSIGSQFYMDEGVPVIRGNNLSLDGNKPKYIDDGYVFLTEEKANELSNAEVLSGDLIFTARGTVGQVGLVPECGVIKWKRAILSANQLRFRNKNNDISSSYLWYLFSSWFIRTQTLLSSDSVAQPNLNLGSLKDLQLLRPSFSEQTQIANFLDHETAKIDTLIEKQQRLIELLKEKRQAVISHAVTKGLNPNAPMKDSGVEWLGDVPEHWVSCSLRYYVTFIDGDRGAAYPNENDLKNDGIIFLSSKNIVEGILDLTEVNFISHEKFVQLNRGKALDGDLIVKVRGSAGRIGELAKFEVHEHGYDTAFINAQMMIIRVGKRLLSNYLRLVSQSLYWTEQLYVGAYGTAQQQLSNEVFSNLSIVIPPLEEQDFIVERLEQNVSTINGLVNKAHSAISLMQERRTALISAAVTGKIDVRHFNQTGE